MNTTTNTRGVSEAMVTHQAAAEALDSLDDYARMGTGVDAHGPRGVLERYIAQQAALSAEPAAQGDAVADTYVQSVPDKCDRIIWRGQYYHLSEGERPAPPAQPAERVPEGLQSALREAAEVLQMVADSGANLPPNWRWPLLDELSGYAHMLLAATPAAPAEEGDGEGVNDTLARELYIASQCDVHNLHTLAWSELTEATRDEWRKKATGAAR